VPGGLRALWLAFLLSGPMNGRNVGRTHPPALGSSWIGRRGIVAAVIAVPVVLAIPGIWSVYGPRPKPAVDDIETVIRGYGFEPLTPPNKLRGPGAIYYVEGGAVRKVCEATAELLNGAVDESPTEDRSRNSLENSRFSLSQSFVQALNGRLDGVRVATIEYGMKNVVIREIPEAVLSTIEQKLMSQKDCEDTVNALLSANKRVCSGYSSLTATLSYKVRFDLKSEISAQARAAAVGVIKQAIEGKSGSEIGVENTEEFSGDNLIYGILMSARCILPDTADRRPKPLAKSS
jgi:hypothetical protein